MAKPLHAGKAAHDGLLSALLAQGGFTGNPRIVESRQGFAETLHGSITPEAALERLDRYRDRFLVRDTLFKYHAACYLTHSAIDATRRLRESSGVRPEAIDSIVVEVPASSLDVCNIQTPTTGLEGKFSLRATVALGFLGADTSQLDTFTDERMRSAELVAMRDRVTVAPTAGTPPTATPVRVRTRDGRELRAVCDVGLPAADLADQGRRLEAKFMALAAPVIGGDRAADLRALVAVDRDAAERGAAGRGRRARAQRWPIPGWDGGPPLTGARASFARRPSKTAGQARPFRQVREVADRNQSAAIICFAALASGWLGAISMNCCRCVFAVAFAPADASARPRW